jgi:hypothetical protein
VAKKKSGSSGVRSVGWVCAVGLACAGAGYYAGKNGGAVEKRIAALTSAEKPGAPAPQTAKAAPEPKPVETHAARPADRAEPARLAKAGEPKAAAASVPAPPSRPGLDEPTPLAISLLEKEAPQGAEAGENLTLSVGFENLAGKPIRAFEGVLKVTDRQDNDIFSSKISVSALISDGATLQWDQRVDAGKLSEKGKRLIGEGKENLKAVFQPKKIFFVDGSVQKFGAKS